MAYNGSCAATVNNLGHPVTHYAQGNGAMHPIQANLALPWNPTQVLTIFTFMYSTIVKSVKSVLNATA